jgi:hypothetical protein
MPLGAKLSRDVTNDITPSDPSKSEGVYALATALGPTGFAVGLLVLGDLWSDLPVSQL